VVVDGFHEKMARMLSGDPFEKWVELDSDLAEDIVGLQQQGVTDI
jgi:hypothetical protein